MEKAMSNEELLEKVRELAAQKDKGAVCPHCGHCKECGRGGHQLAYPWVPPVVPWWQRLTYPYSFPYTITISSQWDTVSARDGFTTTATALPEGTSWSYTA